MAQIIYRDSMKTSSRIALQFTLWIAIISWILLGIINTVFLYGWIRWESQNATQFVVLKNLQPRNPYTDTLQRQERVIAFDDWSFRPHDFPTFWWLNRIRLFDGRRWLVSRSNKFVVLFDVSQNINRQLGLLSASAMSRLLVVFSSFIYGRFFVKRSLRDLNALAQNIRNRDVTKATWWLQYSHLPKNDEINAIARAIENLENRIQWYYWNLRNFVSNVSHELKTPLMVMKSDIDLSKRTKEYELLSDKINNHVISMQSMIDTLLTLSRLQAQEKISSCPILLWVIIEEVSQHIKKKYANKIFQLYIALENEIEQYWNTDLIKILFTNIVDNAVKYSPENTTIRIQINNKNISIENNWYLSSDIIQNMRTPFWQADKNRTDGVGVWLALAKEIIRLHEWHIEYTSFDNKVICTIYFSN